MNCPKCGMDTEYKSGTAKATGKPWQAYQCLGCKTMIGMNGIPWGDKKASVKPILTAHTQQRPITPQELLLQKPQEFGNSAIIAKLNQILEILEENFGAKPKNEETPF